MEYLSSGILTALTLVSPRHNSLVLTMNVVVFGLFLVLSVPVAVLANSCAEHFTCLSTDRTTDYLQFLKLNSSVPNWYELCNCDSLCTVFGDCCRDAPILDQFRLDEWSFVKVRISAKINFMSLMKSKCPSQWKQPNSDVKGKCESASLSPMYDYLLPDVEHLLLFGPEDEFNNWHVTSRTSMITYRNLYCSICNEDTQVDAWSQRLRCSPSSDPGAKCTSVYYQNSADILGKEKLRRTPLQNKVFSSCNLGWYKMNVALQRDLVLDTAKKCVLFYEPVVVRDPKSKKIIVFKNKYCALCNDFDQSAHLCPSEAVDQSTQVPASFNMFTSFDSNYKTGGLIGDTNRTCSADQVYNPLTSACQNVNKRIEQSRPKVVPPGSSLGHTKHNSNSQMSAQLSIVLLWMSLSYLLVLRE